MKKLAIMVAAGLVAGQVFAAAFQNKDVSDSAQWVVHADLELLKQTQVGAYLITQLNTGDVSNKMAAMAAVLRFDPRKDLASVTLYGKSKIPEEGVALFSGAFDVNQLVTLLKANKSYEAAAHRGHAIHSWIDDQKPGQKRQFGCAFSPGRILISQGLPILKEALDVLDGAHAALDADKTFGMALPAEPFFMAGSNLPGFGGGANAQLFSQAQSGRLALGEKGGNLTLAVAVTALDAETAAKLKSVADGLLALAQLRQDQEPALAALLQTARVTLDGTRLQLSLSCPADRAISIIREKMDKPAAPPAVQAAAPAPAGE